MLRDAASGDAFVYVGRVTHSRTSPVRHAFRYPVCLLSFDLEDTAPLERLAPWLGVERRAPVSWHRSDHSGDPATSLAGTARDLVERETGKRPQGAVRLVTSPRVLGYGFNPISFLVCHDASGDVEAIVAEVTSTPWSERHCYVLPVDAAHRGRPVHRFMTPKRLHVSPFLGMEQDYRWRVAIGDGRFSVAISAHAGAERPFAAALSLRRLALRRTTVGRFLVRPPLGAAGVLAAIHLHALRLWWKGAPYHPHPGSAGCSRSRNHDDRALAA